MGKDRATVNSCPMAQASYLTKPGVEKLKNELQRLIEVDRQEIIQKIKEAREYGDLSENAEYDDARAQQALLEGRIEEIEALLKHAKIIDNTKGAKAGMVSVGSVVTVENEGDKMDFTLVGSAESSPSEGLISIDSPTGKALLGSKVGTVATVVLPDGDKVEYKVLAIA